MITLNFHRYAIVALLGGFLAFGAAACDQPDEDDFPSNVKEDIIQEREQETDSLDQRMEDGALGGTPSDRPEPMGSPEAGDVQRGYESDDVGTMGGGTIDDGVPDQETRIPQDTLHDPATSGTEDTFKY